MNRIVQLDVAKAICIMLVVIGHYFPNNSPSWYKCIHDIIYTFHMPLFMFASGYIYIATKKEVEFRTFIIKKFKRLMIPYFTTSIIIITIKLLTQGNMTIDHTVTSMSYIKIFYLPEAGYFLWFIWALWWMFVIIPFFKSKKSRIIFFFISFIIHFLPIYLPNEFCLAECKNMLVFFMFGIFSYESKQLNKIITQLSYKQAIVVILLFIVTEYYHFTSSTNFYIINQIINIIQPYVGIFCIIEISKLICKINLSKDNFIMLVSSSSYIIYLFHTTFEGFTKAILKKITLDNSLWYIFSFEALIIIITGIIIPIILYKYIFNRWSITKVLFGLSK